MIIDRIKVIAFDADDTLWVNEPYFRKAEEDFCKLLKAYMNEEDCNSFLFNIEMKNLGLYGYGIKPFTLSLIEAALSISDEKIPNSVISELIEIGKEMLQKPIELLDGIEETLKFLSKKYKLVVATKGDLLDQERKLIKSGLEGYFHHIEVKISKSFGYFTGRIFNDRKFFKIGYSSSLGNRCSCVSYSISYHLGTRTYRRGNNAPSL